MLISVPVILLLTIQVGAGELNVMRKNIMNNLPDNIRTNKVASWGFALFMGLIFRYVYGIVKTFTSHQIRDYFTYLANTIPESQLVYLTVLFNFIIDFAGAFTAALICGALLVYFLQDKSILFSLGSVVTYLALSHRIFYFWKAPDLGMQISSLIGPILAALIFVSIVWFLVRIKKRITPGSTGSLRAP